MKLTNEQVLTLADQTAAKITAAISGLLTPDARPAPYIALSASYEDYDEYGDPDVVYTDEKLSEAMLSNLKSLYHAGSNIHLTLKVMGPSLYSHMGNRAWPIHEVSIVQVPGCCAVTTLTGAHTEHKYRGKNIGKLFLPFVEQFARSPLGYTQLVATDVTERGGARILRGSGWTELPPTRNPRTDSRVSVFHKLIP